MLRPATPLSILLFVSFVLLLISVISTPIVKGIPLARYQGVNFGVFGWCKDSGECSSVQVGWSTDDALPPSDNSGFDLSSGTRDSLSSLLVVHPVAALCNLIVLGLALAAHFHSPSHSARYLLGLLILLLPTLLITLLAFLVDILLFVPHLQWGGWIVLASTILITASGVVTCAMRRTLVSRKARKKRIAENAEMSGANFYARQAEESKIIPLSSGESKSAMVNGAPGADNLPTFTTYNSGRDEERVMDGPSSIDPVSTASPADGGRYYGSRSRSNSRPRQEDYGAPLGAARGYEDRPPMPPVNPYGSRGRGGYGPPLRGAMASRGGPPSRGPPPSAYAHDGGYSNRGRGGMPGFIQPLGVRRPPPGYRNPQAPIDEPYGPSPPSMANPRSEDAGFEPPSPSIYSDGNAAYGTAAYHSEPQPERRQSPYGYRAHSPAAAMLPQPMPVSMPPMPDQPHYDHANSNRTGTGMVSSHDSDILGMVELQRSHPLPSGGQPAPQEYISPRAGWSDEANSGARSPVRPRRLNSGGSDYYVEDVPAKFAEQPATISAPPPQPFVHDHNPSQIPASLLAGRTANNPKHPSPDSGNSQVQMPRTIPYEREDLEPGARSPVDSEASHFTSVSQRPMNPNWAPGHGGEFNSFGPAGDRRQQQQRKQDILFSNNPDFEIPGTVRGNVGRGGYRGRGGYGMSRQGLVRSPPPNVLDNMGGDGRYPSPIPGQAPGGSGDGVSREV